MTNEAKIIAMKLVDDVRTNGATIVANFDFVTSGIEVGGATLAIGDRGIVMTWCPRVYNRQTHDQALRENRRRKTSGRQSRRMRTACTGRSVGR